MTSDYFNLLDLRYEILLSLYFSGGHLKNCGHFATETLKVNYFPYPQKPKNLEINLLLDSLYQTSL